MKKLNLFLLAAAAACCLPVFGAYPGNPNFRNVSVINTATTRTDWITNVTTIVSESTNPGYAAPIDWDRYAKPIAPGVDHIPAVLTKEGRWPTNMVCHFVRIDLTTPNIRFTGSDRCPEGWGDDMPESISKKSGNTYYQKRTVRERTSDFLARNRGAKSKGGKERDARIAFNLAAWLPWTKPYTNLWAEPYSPLYSDGKSVSFSESGTVANAAGDVVPNSMIVIYKDGTAELTHWISEEDAKRVWFCAPAFVAEMVSAGQIPGHAMQCDPRTAMGISQDRKKLYLFFCDGRLEGWSGGCYWSSLSTLLLAMGSYYAINLDGGGSSTFCVWDDASGKPMIFNRPAGGLRDNGSNAAIYYKAPDAMVGTWIYDDMDFLVQDIVDNEIPAGETTINVLADTTFTAEHPGIPAGTTWTLTTTNNASIGWEDGVSPAIAANSSVTFRNIRLRTSSLSVAAGGKAVLDGATGFTEISTADATGIEIAGTVPAGLRVSCAAAANVGDFFGTSTLPLADARAEARKIGCADNGSFVADAVEVDGVIKLMWSKIVTFGSVAGNMTSLDRGVVNVTVDDCNSDYSAGYKLRFTVKSEDGLRSATKVVDFTGVGDYSFDTIDTSDPAICASGYVFDFTVELVDATGTRVPNSEVASGSMVLGVSENWFSARAADDSAEGGAWTTKPAIESGRYPVAPGSDLDFAANVSTNGRVRYETVVESNGFITDACARQMLESVRTSYSTPHGACFVARGADGSPVWHGLVSENGEPAFRTLRGPAALNTPTKVFCDVDWSSGAPRVRYSVAVGDGAETVLADEAGNTWFAGASGANAATGRVFVSGTGSVASLAGRYVARVLAVEGGYAVWIAEKGITGEPGDTATNGIPNGVRYAFDIDPSKGPAKMGEPIIQVVRDADGNPSVQSRD
ncbi:MAG: phosphodiester glycosidase family protein, partial [Kiritimatiellae bacterium]|nr:phosphodiester glycosidase family protein [Kiritimatiellia bacterium]